MLVGPSTRDYYDLYPALEHAPGDIWIDLPTCGILPFQHLTGVVVSPACDMANRKVETITYLPILALQTWFSIVAALPDIRRVIDGQWRLFNRDVLIEWPKGFYCPTREEMAAAKGQIEELRKERLGAKETEAIDRIAIGLQLVELITSPVIEGPSENALRTLFGEKEWTKILERIVRNSFRTDMHFLPFDEQPTEWSGVASHSVALFRYPITVPFEVLEAAQDVTLGDWKACLARFGAPYPIVAAFENRRPMKRVRLKTPFISDLLSRYISVNLRLGSPDFSDEAVARMCREMGAT